jgi:hypothetical protein
MFSVSATPVPLVIETPQHFKLVAGSTAGCATEARLELNRLPAPAQFEVTSNGEPVEVETH